MHSYTRALIVLNAVVGMDHLSPYKMAKLINDAFLISYNPLSTTNKIEIDHQESPIQVSEYDAHLH